MSIVDVPALTPLCRISCDVAPPVGLGDTGAGERCFVRLLGGRAEGRLEGSLLEGGIDWQWRRADGVLEIDAHYVLQLAADGALVEVRSQGLRHGPPDVMAALARGESVPPSAYFFRTFVRLHSGAPAWAHLNRTLALAAGARDAACVRLALYELG